MRKFVCAVCGLEYATTSTEAEVNREFLSSGQPATRGDQLHSVCDCCYEAVMARARELGMIQ